MCQNTWSTSGVQLMVGNKTGGGRHAYSAEVEVGDFLLHTDKSFTTNAALPLDQFNKRFSQRSSTILALAHDALTEPPSPAPKYLCRRADRRIHMNSERYNVSTLGQFVGQELGVSDWLTVDQERINEFADCTGDHQWIHVDVERAQRESPLGSTITHGYLTLSLLAAMQMELGIVPEGVTQALNYGLDRVRFMAPVKAGARIRTRVVLMALDPLGKGRLLLKTQNTVEIEGEIKPALIAETLALLLTEG